MTRKKVGRILVGSIAVLAALQIYLFQELLVAALMIGLIFAAFALLGGVLYVLRHLGQRALAGSNAYLGARRNAARRGLAAARTGDSS